MFSAFRELGGLQMREKADFLDEVLLSKNGYQKVAAEAYRAITGRSFKKVTIERAKGKGRRSI